MKIIYHVLFAMLLFIFNGNSFAAASNSQPSIITTIESRSSGYHAIYLSNLIPDQGCYLSDRGVIVEKDVSGKTETAIALTALSIGKRIILRVDGCVGIDTNPGSNPEVTASRIVKVQIIN